MVSRVLQNPRQHASGSEGQFHPIIVGLLDKKTIQSEEKHTLFTPKHCKKCKNKLKNFRGWNTICGGTQYTVNVDY